MPTAQEKLLIDKLRDHRRKKQHHRIVLGGTSARDHGHIGQFGEHRKLAMLRNRQLQGKPNTDGVFADNLSEFENSAMVELDRDKETQVVSEFMMAHKKQERKVIISKGTTETSIQKSEINIRTDDNYNLYESEFSVKPDQQEETLIEIPNVDEGLLTKVNEAKVKPETEPVLPQVHHDFSEVSRLKLKVSEEPVMKEEEAQSVQPMQQAVATEDTSVDAEDKVPQGTVHDQDQAPVPGHQTAQDQYQAQDPGCQRATPSHSTPVPVTTHSTPVPAQTNSHPVPDQAHSQPVPEDEAKDQVLTAEDSPKYKPVDVEDKAPDDTVQVLTQDEALGNQASQNLTNSGGNNILAYSGGNNNLAYILWGP
jgi:hypothetical protein